MSILSATVKNATHQTWGMGSSPCFPFPCYLGPKNTVDNRAHELAIRSANMKEDYIFSKEDVADIKIIASTSDWIKFKFIFTDEKYIFFTVKPTAIIQLDSLLGITEYTSADIPEELITEDSIEKSLGETKEKLKNAGTDILSKAKQSKKTLTNIRIKRTHTKKSPKETTKNNNVIETATIQSDAHMPIKARRHHVALGVCCSIIILFISFIVISNYIMPLKIYNEAIPLMSAQKYEQAIEKFELIKDFKNTSEYLTVCTDGLLFDRAEMLITTNNYEAALHYLQKISDCNENSKVSALISKCYIQLEYFADTGTPDNYFYEYDVYNTITAATNKTLYESGILSINHQKTTVNKFIESNGGLIGLFINSKLKTYFNNDINETLTCYNGIAKQTNGNAVGCPLPSLTFDSIFSASAILKNNLLYLSVTINPDVCSAEIAPSFHKQIGYFDLSSFTFNNRKPDRIFAEYPMTTFEYVIDVATGFIKSMTKNELADITVQDKILGFSNNVVIRFTIKETYEFD